MKRRKHQDVAAGSSKDKPKEAKKRKDQHKEEIKNKANKRSKKQERSSLAASALIWNITSALTRQRFERLCEMASKWAMH
jgi:hypothetical protein